jgi:aryl carrier-like protein
VGELFIGGPQLASGYLKDPEQTAQVFLDNPFHPGTIVYATGDLVRLNPTDGSLSFLGRRDTQIKIRGMRVEVGEIEVVLKATSNIITNAAVIKVDIGHGCLIAFLEYPSAEETGDVMMVHHDSLGAFVESLRHAVRQKLPSYMAPMTYVPLNRLPLTTSGKLDRNALQAFFVSHEKDIRQFERQLERHAAIQAAKKKRTRAQTRIMRLWQGVLDISEDIDIDATFTVMGGDSIGLMRLGAMAHKRGIPLSVTDQLQRPTIREQAKLVPRK